MYVATSGKMVLTCARTRVGIGHANVEFPARGTSGTLQLAAPIAGASQMLATLSQCDFQASRSSTDQGAWVAAGLSKYLGLLIGLEVLHHLACRDNRGMARPPVLVQRAPLKNRVSDCAARIPA